MAWVKAIEETGHDGPGASPQLLHKLRQKDCNLGDGLSEFKINSNKLVESNIKVGRNSVAEHPSGYTTPWVQFPRKRHSVKALGVHCSHEVAGAGSQGLSWGNCLCHYLFKDFINSRTTIPGYRKYTVCTAAAHPGRTLDEPWHGCPNLDISRPLLRHERALCEQRRPPRISALHRMETPCTRTTFSKCPCS